MYKFLAFTIKNYFERVSESGEYRFENSVKQFFMT